jgi:hypothetical protein
MTPAPGQTWRDDTGTARVLAVVLARKGEFAVMERITPKASRPFVVPVAEMLRGFDGWRVDGTG